MKNKDMVTIATLNPNRAPSALQRILADICVPVTPPVPAPITSVTTFNGSNDERITACTIAQMLIRKYIFLVEGNLLFVYDSQLGHFRRIDEIELGRILQASFPRIVAKLGNMRIVSQVYEWLIMDSRLLVKDCMRPQGMIAFRNGVLNTRSGAFFHHSANLFFTSCVNTEYDTQGIKTCPVFERFLEEITQGDTVLQTRLWEVVGYLVTPPSLDAWDGKFIILLQGRRNSGKSVIGRFFQSLFAPENQCAIEPNALGRPFIPANLQGRALCTAMDIPSSKLNGDAMGMLKKLTGGDSVTADVKYKEPVTFHNTCKMLYAMNGPLYTEYPDYALLSRFVVVPFYWSIPYEQQDPFLAGKIEQESSAIVTKGLRFYSVMKAERRSFSGCYKLNDAINRPEVTPYVNHSADLEVAIGKFIEEYCIF